MNVEIAGFQAYIQKDHTLTRTRTDDIRESGQSQYCTANAFAQISSPHIIGFKVRPFHKGAFCGDDDLIRGCMAGLAPGAAIDVNVPDVRPQ
jgi:hypothetical protein